LQHILIFISGRGVGQPLQLTGADCGYRGQMRFEGLKTSRSDPKADQAGWQVADTETRLPGEAKQQAKQQYWQQQQQHQQQEQQQHQQQHATCNNNGEHRTTTTLDMHMQRSFPGFAAHNQFGETFVRFSLGTRQNANDDSNNSSNVSPE